MYLIRYYIANPLSQNQNNGSNFDDDDHSKLALNSTKR